MPGQVSRRGGGVAAGGAVKGIRGSALPLGGFPTPTPIPLHSCRPLVTDEQQQEVTARGDEVNKLRPKLDLVPRSARWAARHQTPLTAWRPWHCVSSNVHTACFCTPF